MKNTMKLNALGILVALSVAGQAEAGVRDFFGRGPKAPQLPKVTVTPKAEASSGKAEYLMAGLSAFGGQALAMGKSAATKVASGVSATKTAGVAFAKTGVAKYAALPVKAKAGIAVAAASVVAYGAYRGAKAVYNRGLIGKAKVAIQNKAKAAREYVAAKFGKKPVAPAANPAPTNPAPAVAAKPVVTQAEVLSKMSARREELKAKGFDHTAWDKDSVMQSLHAQLATAKK